MEAWPGKGLGASRLPGPPPWGPGAQELRKGLQFLGGADQSHMGGRGPQAQPRKAVHPENKRPQDSVDQSGVQMLCACPVWGAGGGVLGFASRPRQGLCLPHHGPGCLDPRSSQQDTGASSMPPVGPAQGRGAPFGQRALKEPGRETPALRGRACAEPPPRGRPAWGTVPG